MITYYIAKICLYIFKNMIYNIGEITGDIYLITYKFVSMLIIIIQVKLLLISFDMQN